MDNMEYYSPFLAIKYAKPISERDREPNQDYQILRAEKKQDLQVKGCSEHKSAKKIRYTIFGYRPQHLKCSNYPGHSPQIKKKNNKR
jgi:hypothetical protein